jgi:hypothetical protein
VNGTFSSKRFMSLPSPKAIGLSLTDLTNSFTRSGRAAFLTMRCTVHSISEQVGNLVDGGESDSIGVRSVPNLFQNFVPPTCMCKDNSLHPWPVASDGTS